MGLVEQQASVQDPFYILAPSSRADERTRVLKHDDTFAVFDHYGDVVDYGLGEQGLYHGGTRFLSRLELRLGTVRPLFLSSTVKKENDLLLVHLSNPDIPLDGESILPRGTLHLLRTKFLWEAAAHERLRVTNHGLVPVQVELALLFEADFADIFEVRGTRRERRGVLLEAEVAANQVVLRYRGRDEVLRRTHLLFSPPPRAVFPNGIRYVLDLSPQQPASLTVAIECEAEREPPRFTFEEARGRLEAGAARLGAGGCRIETSNELFNEWMARSGSDLHMMVTDTPHGPYPYAGVPWFSTPFGRDGIITALETLWMDPGMARGVLAFLAATQAPDARPEQDAEAGKILHETRQGEMAALGEVPFGRYYGSVDATPLFVLLAGEYYVRTGDRPFVESLWGNLEAALGWIDGPGDPDGDGFVEYHRKSPTGLLHQGWKDSGDAVFHADGTLAEGPIALCEVQGYVYAARQAAARLATRLGRAGQAEEQREKAERLRRAFEERFWCEDLGTYALALDGEKRPCRVRASNAGHALFAGICSEERALRIAAGLLDPSSFSGWGVRTLAKGERRYNPMGYHNGSVWPHDNALLAMGLSRYGLREEAGRILGGLFDASHYLELRRMPELFCGFRRRPGEGPTLYPVACSPQSWAAGSVFLLLQACLGLSIDVPAGRVTFTRPWLPDFLPSLRIEGLRVGEATVDLGVQRYPRDVGIHVLRREGEVEVVAVS